METLEGNARQSAAECTSNSPNPPEQCICITSLRTKLPPKKWHSKVWGEITYPLPNFNGTIQRYNR